MTYRFYRFGTVRNRGPGLWFPVPFPKGKGNPVGTDSDRPKENRTAGRQNRRTGVSGILPSPYMPAPVAGAVCLARMGRQQGIPAKQSGRWR